MEFIFGAIIAGILIFFFSIKKKVDSFSKLSRLSFQTWHSLYSSSQMPETHGMARALITQAIHLAAEFGVLNQVEKNEINNGTKSSDPVQLVNEWLEYTLPKVLSVIDEQELLNCEARLVGVFALVSLKGVYPERDLRNFLQRFNH